MLPLEIFGRSHENYIGARLDGLPAGEPVDIDALIEFMQRRSPKHRKEDDIPEIKSGICNGVTDGKPLEIVIYNHDARPEDYEELRYIPRPGHADYPAYIKYNGEEDMRGGGKFSGRMTAAICAVGGVAKQILEHRGITIEAEKQQSVREVPAGDSVGGIISCTVKGMPVGIGDALFDGLDGAIAYYIFGIPGVKGIEFGAGFRAAEMLGSENNDGYEIKNGKVNIKSNNAGGILGGISSGENIEFRVAFKPTPSIALKQNSVNLKTLENIELEIKGRHDVCIADRASPIVEAAASLAILAMMPQQSDNLESIRNTVDIIDRELVELLNKRFELTDRAIDFKSSVLDITREKEVFENIRAAFGSDELDAVFGDIMKVSRDRQENK